MNFYVFVEKINISLLNIYQNSDVKTLVYLENFNDYYQYNLMLFYQKPFEYEKQKTKKKQTNKLKDLQRPKHSES